MKLLTKERLQLYLKNNTALNSVFSYSDPNIIANIIITELSRIIELISPSKKIQCSKSHAPWIHKNFKIQANIRDNLHSIAIRIDTQEAWRDYRNQRNLVNRLVKYNKNKYYSNRLNIHNNIDNDTDNNTDCDNDIADNDFDNDYIYNDKQMWQTVKNMTNTKKQSPPRLIKYKNKVITKLKQITNIANNHFTDKIYNIRSNLIQTTK